MLAMVIATLLAAGGGAPDGARCAAADLTRQHPAEALAREDGFRDRLSTADRARLDAALPRDADGGIAQCAGHDGATCDVKAYVDAFNATGLTPRFLASLCPKP